MWWQVAKDVQKGQVAKDYHKHQSHQLQPRKLGNLPAKVEVETVDHNQLEWPLSPSSMIDWSHMWWQVAKVVQQDQVAKDYHKHQSHQLQPRKLGNLPAKVEVETVDHNQLEWPLSPSSMIDWSHMWWQVAKVVQKDQVAKDYHKHQSRQLQPRKLGNLPAIVDVETVDHNQLNWPMSPSRKRWSQTSV